MMQLLRLVKDNIRKKHFVLAAIFISYLLLGNYFFGYICPMMVFIGIPCPACGMTRAGLLLLSGNFVESFRMHPLLIPSILFLIGLVLFKFMWTDKFKYIQNLSIVLLVSFLVLYVFRMVMLFPNYPPMVINSDSILHNIINLLRERN